jgi:hypothetical protein
MNARPTPETDALRDLYENYEYRANVGDIWELCEFFERERNELKRWTSVNGVIDLQRERDEAQEQLAAMTAQRDRLAEALQKVVTAWDCSEWLDENDFEAFRATLQSLTPKP